MYTSPDAPLTEKQETFAVVFVQTANAAEAYRTAYDVAPDARDEWIYVEASQLLDHPKVGPRIEELKEKAKERSQFTVFAALDELDEARQDAKSLQQPSAMISATNSKIKLLGMDKPQRVQQIGKDGAPVDPETVSDTELARRLAFLLTSGVQQDDT